MRTTRTGAFLVPSPRPVFRNEHWGERARVRGQIAGRLPDVSQRRSRTIAAPRSSVPSTIPPHPNPLPPETGGRGDKKRIDQPPYLGDLWSIFGGDE